MTKHPFAFTLLLLLLSFGQSILNAQTVILSEDFTGPVKQPYPGADGSLGSGGTGAPYDTFGTWVYSGGNSGIDEFGEGSEDGSGPGNQLSSIGLNRPQDFRGTNARANWVIFESSNFADGLDYTISFDVIGDGDPGATDNGRYWLAEIYGYDDSGFNFIEADGTHGGWGGGAKPWVGNGSATVNFIEDDANNGVPIMGETAAGSTEVSFTFTYDGTNGADIGFAIGTYNNAFAIDNFEIVELPAPPPETVIEEEDFLSPATASNSGTTGFLGTGGAGFDYNGGFGTWLFHSFNGGINEAGEGLEDGSGNGNQFSSIGLNRPQDFRVGNGRANWVILDGSGFTDGTEYTVSFDVIGDAAGADNGRYWLAELYGYDTSGANYIQGQGAHGGWGGAQPAKPWTAVGSATVNMIEDSSFNGVPLMGETVDAVTTNSFNFVYDGTNSADIGFAVGTYANAFAIDNFKIVEYVPPPPIVPGAQDTSKPNFLIMVPDDHRWDATGYLQDAIAANQFPGRIARFPYLSGTTPGLDSLADEGVLFQNAFVVYSLCSPARATMLTGLHAHKHGVTDNKNPFPRNLVTYASILQDNGYETGYFGKWHMGDQVERPGFDKVATFINQGNYYGSLFVDENGGSYPADTTTWVDDRSTDFALDFVDEQVADGQPFLAFVGFKTPHTPRTPPARHSTTYDGTTPEDVPNLQKTNGVVPLWDPNTSQGASANDTRNYMKVVAGIDDNVESLLARLDQPGWEEVRANTVVIYISDQGLFRNEHGLGDKRAPYEESIRTPFIIRYPNLQTTQDDAVDMALNLDIAPTILDLANVEVPSFMQGRSLKPLVENPVSAPTDWRDSFLFTYNFDQEFPNGGVPEFVAIRNANGDKYVEYAENSAWNELFTGDDLYEVDNKINDPAYAALLEELRSELDKKSAEEGFLRVHGVENQNGLLSMNLEAGDSYLYVLKTSPDLDVWTPDGTFEGSGVPARIDLLTDVPTVWESEIPSELTDYTLAPGNVVGGQNTALVNVGVQNAVLVFNLPAPPQPGYLPSHAQLEVHANKKFAKFDVDLHRIGYTDSAGTTIPAYHTSVAGVDAAKLQDTFLDENLPHSQGDLVYVLAPYTSNPNSALTSQLRAFYADNPDYAGGQYIHLRLNANLVDPPGGAFFRVKMADNDANTSDPAPTLRLNWDDPSEPALTQEKQFYRVTPGHR